MENFMEIDKEKIQKATLVFEKIDIIRLSKAIVELLRVYANFSKKLGEIEKENVESFEAFKYLGEIAPGILRSLAEKSPPADFGIFIKAFLELYALTPKLNNMIELPAEEKIEVGKKLEEIAESLSQLITKIEEKQKEAPHA